MTKRSPFAHAFPASTVYEEIGDATVPWRFASLDAEYAALRGGAGLLDLSGAGLLAIEGPAAEALLSGLFTREVDFLSPESSTIGMLLGENAEPLDLVTVFKTDDGYVVETSIGRGTSTLAHLGAHASDGVTVRDLAGEQVLVGFEGPTSWEVAEALLDEPITGLPFGGVRPVSVDGIPATVARSGFTGEFGFKVFCLADGAEAIWAKASAHMVPVGQEALEVAMVEVRQPILHREAPAGGSVIGGGFNWLVDLEKEEFLGRNALCAARDRGPDFLPVSFLCDGDAVEPGTPIMAGSEEIGRVVHSVRSPDLRLCGIAQLRPELATSGLVLELAGGTTTLRTVSVPTRIPTSWAAMVASGGR